MAIKTFQEFISESKLNGLHVDEDGNKRHYKDSVLHNDNGPALERANGTKIWYKNGKIHRDDGPAIENIYGDKEFYKNGKLHNDSGPAIDRTNGTKEWYLNNKKVTQEEHAKLTAKK